MKCNREAIVNHVPYLLAVLILAIFSPVFGQDQAATSAVQAVAPQSPPPLPVNSVGWTDFFIKKLPGILGTVLPMALILLKAHGRTVFAKIPREWAPIVSAVLAALASLADSGLGSVMLDGGGVAPDTAAATGAGTALITHALANKMLATYESGQVKS